MKNIMALCRVREKNMESVWFAHGQHTDNTWGVRERAVESTWRARGEHMESTWREQRREQRRAHGGTWRRAHGERMESAWRAHREHIKSILRSEEHMQRHEFCFLISPMILQHKRSSQFITKLNLIVPLQLSGGSLHVGRNLASLEHQV